MAVRERAQRVSNRQARSRIRLQTLNWPFFLGLVLVALIVYIAVQGSSLAPHDPLEQNAIFNHEGEWFPAPLRALEVPGYPLGTDQFGRDLLSQLLWAVRPTMVMVSVVAVVRLLAGMSLGLAAGWMEGRLARLLDSLIASALSIPVLLVALGVIALVGGDAGLPAFVFGLALTGWADTARLVREQTRQIKQQLYIEAANSIGASQPQILTRHVLRQVMPMAWMLFAFEISATLLVTAGLGFLGYYIGGDTFILTSDTSVSRVSGLPEIGQMLATSWISLTEPWGLFASGGVVLAIVLGFNMLGEGLKRQFSQMTRMGLLNRVKDRFGLSFEHYITYPLNKFLLKPLILVSWSSMVLLAVTAWSWFSFVIPADTFAPVILGPPGEHQWGSERRDSYGTLWTGAVGPTDPDIIWRFHDPTGYTGGLVVDELGQLYFTSAGGRVYSLNESGELRWFTQLDVTPVGTPALDAQGNIHITDDQGGLSMISPDGALVRRVIPPQTNVSNAGPVIGPDDTAYYATGSLVHAVAGNGVVLWTRNSGAFDLSPTAPRLSPDGRYLLLDDVVLVTLDGSLPDFSVVEDAARGTNTQFTRNFYLVDPSGRAYLASRSVAAEWQANANDIPTVEERITWDPSLTLWGDPADEGVTPSKVVWRMFTDFTNVRFDTILQWIAADGTTLGNVQYGHRPSRLIAADGNDTLFTCGLDSTQNNQMGCLSWSKGAEAPNWEITLERPLFASGGALIENRLYVLTFNGVMLAIGPSDLDTVVHTAPAYAVVVAQQGNDQNQNGGGQAEDGEPVATPLLGVDNPFDAAYFTLLGRDAERVIELGLSEAFGMDPQQLTNVSPAYEAATFAEIDRLLEDLHALDQSEFSQDETVSYAIFDWYLEDLSTGADYAYYQYPLNHLFGEHTGLANFFVNSKPFETQEDMRNYLAWMTAVNQKSIELVEWLQAQEALGIIPPRFMVEHVLAQIQLFSTPEPEDHPIYLDFDAKLIDMPGFNESQKNRFRSDALTATRQRVLVGFRKLENHFLHLLDIAQDDDVGLGDQPGGEAAYNYWLQHHTTTELTADDIHQLGLEEVERITAEMEVIFAEVGISGAGMEQKMNQVAAQSGVLDSQDVIVAGYEELIEQAPSLFSEYFEFWPATELEVVAFDSPTAPGAYYIHPPLDGSGPGWFFVNTNNPTARFGMPTLAYHEAIPGHHLQIGLQQEIADLPVFRTDVTFTGYAEGWALYAEFLAAEAGIYADDPLADLGRLQGELFRAARMVVDTGIHSQDWTHEQAITYMVETTGMPRSFMVAEVERYFVWPGQAAAYKIGMLQILDLRQQAMDALGDDFDMIAFHNVILQNGSMPLAVLEQVVLNWIAEQ
jgi:uncharacterized protein (DUF885 family)/ABC-type dipeptide/oligopeptide/nickel transport system permease subunit